MPNYTIVGTLSLIELVWLVVNTWGFLYSFANAMDVRGDYKALKRYRDATVKDWVIVKNRARRAIVGTVLQFLFILFGLAAGFTINPPTISIPALAISIVLLGGTGLLSWLAWKDNKDKRTLRGNGK